MHNVEQLQAWLKEQELAGIVIYSSDEFQNEYTPPSGRRLNWATGFSGSVGQAVVLQNSAAVFVDGRYTVQAHQQVDPERFTVESLVSGAVPAWLKGQVQADQKIALDPKLHTGAEVAALSEALAGVAASLVELEFNPVDELWKDQPAPEREAVEIYALHYAGVSSIEKRLALAETLKEQGLSAYMLTAPEELAWLLNIRGQDLPATPVCLSYALMEASGDIYWFLDESRISEAQRQQLDEGITLVKPDDLESFLIRQSFSGPVAINPARTPWHIHKILAALVGVAPTNVLEVSKACKNEVELEGARNAQHIDGIAMIKFLAWIESSVPQFQVTELDVVEKVTEFRQASTAFDCISFTPISASGPNAALAHYSVTAESNRVINNSNMFLLDSGGQYKGGTTDITRTLSLGEATDFQKKCFTLVLKGHIALAKARFPQGTTGAHLDAFARQYLWQEGLDYAHGTGHGVGSYLSVHEGPTSISKRPIAEALRPGMIMSNEPGYYLEGEFGIRIENLVIVKEAPQEGFLEFETITEVPLDPGLVEVSMLSAEEKNWLRDYHERIAKRFSHELEGETRRWLAQKVEFFLALPE